MRRPALHALAAAALAAGALAAPSDHAAAQRATVARTAAPGAGTSMSQLMAPWELEATGVARLSADERRALEGWLGRYTAALRGGAGGGASGGATAGRVELPSARPVPMDTIRPAPRSRPGTPPRPIERPTRIALSVDALPNALEVVAVHDGGDLIETDDGSLWETYLPDRFNVGGWRVGQQVVVRGNPLAPQLSGARYDVTLQNGEARTSVGARYAGRQIVDPALGGTGNAGGESSAP